MNTEDASPSGKAQSNRCQGSSKTVTRVILSQNPANKAFARRAQHDWSTQLRQGSCPTQKFKIPSHIFTKTNTRIDGDLIADNPSPLGTINAATKRSNNIYNHIIIMRIPLHGLRPTTGVHHDQTGA